MKLDVYLEQEYQYRLVGSLDNSSGELSFEYHSDYKHSPDALPIFASLPLKRKPGSKADFFWTTSSKACFEALLPEGKSRSFLARTHRVDMHDTVGLLNLRGEESIGALIFSKSGKPIDIKNRYEPLPEDILCDFTAHPLRISNQLMGRARLSLAGEVTKLGLYRHKNKWYLPLGSAPSTHIIKAPITEYENQILNEAICLGAARYCGLLTSQFELVDVGESYPLLIIERFDRAVELGSPHIDGLPRPKRYHQQDFCQILGIGGIFKYEPDGAEFLELMFDGVKKICPTSFENEKVLFEQLVFRTLIGDCDGHLKNYGFLHSERLNSGSITPLYDVNCTTIYPELDRHPAIRIGNKWSKTIDEIEGLDLLKAAERLDVFPEYAKEIIYRMLTTLPEAVEKSFHELENDGFKQAGEIGEAIKRDIQIRCQRIEKDLSKDIKSLIVTIWQDQQLFEEAKNLNSQAYPHSTSEPTNEGACQ